MQRLIVAENGDQNLVGLTEKEITELEQIAALPKPPRTADKRRLRTALFMLRLLDPLMFAIRSAGPVAVMQWEDTTIFHEDSQLVQTLIQSLGWDAIVVDSIFEMAGSLS